MLMHFCLTLASRYTSLTPWAHKEGLFCKKGALRDICLTLLSLLPTFKAKALCLEPTAAKKR